MLGLARPKEGRSRDLSLRLEVCSGERLNVAILIAYSTG